MAASRHLFVGRLNWTLCAETLQEYFSQFGKVRRARVIYDLDTGRSKGYGFVDMESPEAVNTIMSNVPHHINKFRVDVKTRMPAAERKRETALPSS